MIHHRQVGRRRRQARARTGGSSATSPSGSAPATSSLTSRRADIFDELRVASKGGVARLLRASPGSGSTARWASSGRARRRSSRHAAALRRRALRPSRRQGAVPAGRVAPGRRGAGRRVSDRADHRPRGVAVPVGHADPAHRRAGRPVPAAASARSIRGSPTRSASPTATSSRVESRRGAVDRARPGRDDHPARHGVRPLSLAARRGRRTNCTIRALDPISKIPEFKICAVRVSKAPDPTATSPRSSRRPEASDERARVLHRLLALHRLPGLRAGLRGVRHPPRATR